jgi:cytochrome oxidase assembly protein ShyY1
MANPLSNELMAEHLDNIRIQNLNVAELSRLLQLTLYPFALQPAAGYNWPLPQQALPQPWQPLPMPSAKHYGYAFQWFAMATVWFLIMLLLLLRQLRKYLRSPQ